MRVNARNHQPQRRAARPRAGKGAARATRRAGRVPAIVYGDNKEPALISLEPRELARVLARPGFFDHLVEISVDGATHRTLPREVQYHPVTDAPLHVDFQRVGAGAQVTVAVPVVFINQEQLARAAPRRHPQHRAPRDRDGVLGRQHPRADRRRPDRARYRRQHPYRRGRAAAEGAARSIQERDFTIASIARLLGGARGEPRPQRRGSGAAAAPPARRRADCAGGRPGAAPGAAPEPTRSSASASP